MGYMGHQLLLHNNMFVMSKVAVVLSALLVDFHIAAVCCDGGVELKAGAVDRQ